MTTPIVTEIPLRLEPVTIDPFIVDTGRLPADRRLGPRLPASRPN